MGAEVAPGTNSFSLMRIGARQISRVKTLWNGLKAVFFVTNMKLFFWKKQTKDTGSFGERVATEYLKKKGYSILERNYANTKGRRVGELDIVALYKGEIVFVEVKTREWEKNAPLPEESVNRKKLHRLEKIAVLYLKAQKKESAAYHFDVIAIFLDSFNKQILEIRHLERVFL